jgi:hypothetical protein
MPLYLAYGISGVWALGSKLQFHQHWSFPSEVRRFPFLGYQRTNTLRVKDLINKCSLERVLPTEETWWDLKIGK